MNYIDRLIELVKISGETISENAAELVSLVPYSTSFDISIHFVDNGKIDQIPEITVSQGFLADPHKVGAALRRKETDIS